MRVFAKNGKKRDVFDRNFALQRLGPLGSDNLWQGRNDGLRQHHRKGVFTFDNKGQKSADQDKNFWAECHGLAGGLLKIDASCPRQLQQRTRPCLPRAAADPGPSLGVEE
jgi:hypothetical protein